MIAEKREVAHFAIEQLVNAEPGLVTEQELHALATSGRQRTDLVGDGSGGASPAVAVEHFVGAM